jgi:hypothetical protein
MGRKPPLKVFMDNLDNNKTHLQKYMAGAFLFCQEVGDSEMFVDIMKNKGLREVEIIGVGEAF